jgi:hypothetical protein
MITLDKYIVNNIMTSMKPKTKHINISFKPSESPQELAYSCPQTPFSKNAHIFMSMKNNKILFPADNCPNNDQDVKSPKLAIG